MYGGPFDNRRPSSDAKSLQASVYSELLVRSRPLSNKTGAGRTGAQNRGQRGIKNEAKSPKQIQQDSPYATKRMCWRSRGMRRNVAVWLGPGAQVSAEQNKRHTWEDKQRKRKR